MPDYKKEQETQVTDQEDTKRDAQWRQEIRAMIRKLPKEYADLYPAARSLRTIFHEELAEAITPVFNSFAATLVREEEPRVNKAVGLINEHARLLGLTIRCPRTSRPATLIVDSQDADHPDRKRFRFVVRDERNRAQRSLTSSKLPDLQLMVDPPRVESFSRSFRWGGPGKDEPAR